MSKKLMDKGCRIVETTINGIKAVCMGNKSIKYDTSAAIDKILRSR